MKNLFSLSTIFFLFSFFLVTQTMAQTSYTWNGSSSTDFATAANWTPSGVPGSGDNITIVTTSNDPVLDGNRTVNNLTLTNGVFDLGGHTLTTDGTVALNGGTMEDGTFYKTSGTVSFSGTVIDCLVDVTATTTIGAGSLFKQNAILQNVTGWGSNTTFEGKADLKLTHYNTYTGGNVFKDTTFITAASVQGYSQRLGHSVADTFLSPVTFHMTTHMDLYVGNGSTGNYFADDVTFHHSSTSSSTIYINNGGSSTYDGDIILVTDSTAGHIKFNSGSVTHNGNLLLGAEGYHGGILTINSCYHQSAANAIDLTVMNNTSKLVLGTDLELEGDLDGPNVHTTLQAGVRFKGNVTLPKLEVWSGSTTCEGKADLKMTYYNTYVGGNMFKDSTMITAASAQGYAQGMGAGAPDTCLAPVTFHMTSNQTFYLCNSSTGNYFADNVTIRNSGYGSSKIYIGHYGTSGATFDGDILVESDNGGGIYFYDGDLVHNGLLKIGPNGFSNGVLSIDDYEQTVSGTIDLSAIDNTASISILDEADITAELVYSNTSRSITLTGATLRGNVTVESPSLSVTNCSFFGTTVLEKNAGGSNNLNGGNTFHGATSIENSSSGNYVYWGYSNPDTILGDLTLINHSSQPLWMNYSTEGHYGGDIVLDGDASKIIRFGNTTSGKKAVFDGSTDQNLSIDQSALNVQLYRAEVNKSGGRLKISNDVSVDYQLELTDGIIECLNDAVLTLKDGVAPTATDSSYVEGAVKKIGNDAFTFPVGRNGVYRPISITAPSNVTDAFAAEYFESNSDWIHSHSSKASSLDYLSTNEYWTLTRNVGSSTPVVKLSWDTVTSCVMDPALSARHVAGWDGTQWDDLGNGATTGTADKGTISTSSGVSDFNMFVLESDSALGCGECQIGTVVALGCDVQQLVDSVSWFSFTADSTDLIVSCSHFLSDSLWGGIRSVELLGHCRGETPLAQAELGTLPHDSTSMDLTLTSLETGSTYWLKVSKTAGFDTLLIDLCIMKMGGECPISAVNCANLVPNPGFEQMVAAPCGPIGTGLVCDWFAVSGTPDLYTESCNNMYQVGGGGTAVTDQAGGSSFAGLYTLRNPLSGNNNREYISAELTRPMVTGQCYWVSYQTVNHGFNNQSFLQSTAPQIAFTENSLTISGGAMFQIVPAGNRLNPIGGYPVLACPFDNAWTTIEGFYTANGVEDHVTLGNFLTTANTAFAANAPCQTYNGTSQFARFMLDNIQVVDLLFHETDVIACGGSVAIGCAAVEGLTYSWSSSPSGFTSTNSQITVSPTQPTVYTLTVTDVASSTSCSSSVTINLDGCCSPENAISISGCEYTCEGTCTLTVDLTGYGEIVWSGMDDPSIVWSGQGTETVVITDWGDLYGQDMNICVSGVDGEGKYKCNCIDLKGCCTPPSSEVAMVVNLSVSDFNSTAGAPPVSSNIINVDFTVTGTMTVDQNLTLEGCEVTLAEGATIEVLSPFTLTITDNGTDNSWLHACGDFLWHKLIVWEGGNLTVQNGTVIEDAYFGTLFRGNGMLDVRNTIYDKNVFHVFVNLKSDHTTAIISNNEFICTDQLNSNSLNWRETLAGLFAENSSIASGTSTEWPGTANDDLVGNHFANAKWGIRGENSNVSLYTYNLFEFIRKADSYGGWQNGGWGVQCYAPPGSNRKFEALKSNTFRDSDCGILTSGMNETQVETSANFTRLDGGVNAMGVASLLDGIGILTHASTGNVLINGNVFTNCEWGIKSQYSNLDATESVMIQNNTITHTPPYNPLTAGVGAIGFGPNDASNVFIGRHPDNVSAENEIQNMAYGVLTTDLNMPVVHHNKISVVPGFGTGSFGVLAVNCPNAQIVVNEILGGGAGNHFGILTQSCPFADIRCNDISNTESAIYNYGGMMGALVENNVMEDCTNGYVHKDGFINNQGSSTVPSDNEWVSNGSFTCHSKNFVGNGSAIGGGLNTFFVRNTTDDYNPAAFTPCVVNGSPFFQIETQASMGSISDTDCDSVPQFRSRNPTAAKAIALDTLVFYGTDSIEAREWARLHLYRALRYDTIYIIDSTFTAFVDTMDLTAYRELDSIVGQLAFPLDSATEKHLLDANTKVVTADTLQSLFKEVLRIGIDHYFSNDSTWTGSDILYLREVAALCPLKYGPGVYQARSLLLSMDTIIVFYANDCELPIEPSGKRDGTAPTEREHHGTLKLYPNPTTGSVSIECHLNDEDVAELRVLDMSGRVVYRDENVCGPNAIILNGLSEGLYHCVLIVNGKASLSEKLVILRE